MSNWQRYEETLLLYEKQQMVDAEGFVGSLPHGGNLALQLVAGKTPIRDSGMFSSRRIFTRRQQFRMG